MISTFPTVLLFAAAIWTSYAGFYGVALAASAMMATTIEMNCQKKSTHFVYFDDALVQILELWKGE
jgi:hypothetical protein